MACLLHSVASPKQIVVYSSSGRDGGVTGVAGQQGKEKWGAAAGGRRGHGSGNGSSGSCRVYCVGSSEAGGHHHHHHSRKEFSRDINLFDVQDPRVSSSVSGGLLSRKNGGKYDVNMAWELLRQDVLFLDWKARQDVLAIVAAHDKVCFGWGWVMMVMVMVVVMIEIVATSICSRKLPCGVCEGMEWKGVE